jgi:N-acetylneuraminate lyase
MMLYAGGNRHYVGSTYNYMNSLYLKLIDAHYKGENDTVLQLQKEADSMYKIILAYNNIIAGKEIMRIIGMDCGPVRIPLKALTPAEKETFFRKISDTSLFAYTTQKNLTTKAL